ncbi:OmpH family outer membrane protein [Rubinisphaera margarita]|uniref:OmpH family outer membrane protein n=1 Tax=Rubinisphaera margarita TaxID=2909586 RepID=UPI0021BCE7FC|nr:OmpH family outer membrane protein [Rubinisphaera margarita]
MLRLLVVLSLLAPLSLLVGCGGSSNNSTVAIVNLDTVLKLTGADLEIATAIQEREKQIMAGLTKFQQDLEKQYEEKQQEIGESPTDEQKRELQALLNRLNSQNQQARQQASQNISTFQQDLYERFQEQAGPVSLEVAKEQGYSIVIGQNPSILAFDTSVDITDLVVERMKAMKTEGGSAAPGGEAPATPGLPPNGGDATPIAPPGAPVTPPATPITPPASLTPSTPAATSTPATTSAPAPETTSAPPKTSTETALPAGTSDSTPDPVGTNE